MYTVSHFVSIHPVNKTTTEQTKGQPTNQDAGDDTVIVGVSVVLGHMHQFFLCNHPWLPMDQAYKKYSREGLFGRYEIFSPVLIVTDPEILKQILVKDFDNFTDRRKFGDQPGSIMTSMLSNMDGEEWKILRSIMTPTFSSGKMKRMFGLVCTNADSLVASCLNDAQNNLLVDMKDKCGRFTMDTIASCAFGIEPKSMTDEKPVFAQKADNFFSMSPFKFVRFMLMFMLPKVFDALGLKVDTADIDFFRDVVEKTIRSRQQNDRQRGDFLDLMLNARETDNEEEKTNQDKNLSTKSAKHVLTNHTVLAQCIMFLIAGYDTTASTLAFASQLLAKDVKVQQQLREEIQKMVKEEGELTYQGVMEAKLLDACINETLRMYPPGALGERKCTRPYKVAGTEVTLMPGDLLQFPIWSFHRDPHYWTDPETFKPQRFLPDNKANITPFTFMPFGMGPRNCIAMRFAQMEAKVALAKLLLCVELQVVPGHDNIILDSNSFLLRPKDGQKIRVTPIKQE
ncbi:hypothetical protein Pmani_020812 [Petrolisthes manimaculis]|uniref:Cytochrome P450 n=1 Tax=Petrolisthes manimaculis TaxID=1843537 RepID=A0AAE1PFG6_9EUCA|nr:hypothetical protein Pmani_020812 [Petrolisthes manimaculis]